MKNPKDQSFLGLAKVLFNSSACHIALDNGRPDVEIISSERITRKKGCGEWPYKAIELVHSKINQEKVSIAENRDVLSPKFFEEKLNLASPFFEFLKSKKYEMYSTHFNSDIKYLTHHLAHAYCCLGMSPFEESIIVIMDGAGSLSQDHKNNILLNSENDHISKNENLHEEFSAYYQKQGELTCIHKVWQKFENGKKMPNHSFTEGAGLLYEKGAEYLFNSKRAAGKVMGLAPFGKAKKITDPKYFLDQLDWSKAYKGNSKEEWENSVELDNYKNLAASIQSYFEEIYISRIRNIKNKYPHVKNIIIAGGCALNCVSNMKIVKEKIFENVYVPPFPGDEGISFGLAHYMMYENGQSWKVFKHEDQHGYFGAKSSEPNDKNIEEIFKNYKITRSNDLAEDISELIKDNNIIAWFQGRSESGPRALGNRSIIARVDYPNLKKYLNDKIKFREGFRPYGCSVLQDKAAEYFDIADDFQNPYMSFAAPLRTQYRELFKEVAHIDGTSRKQSVTPGQNKKFYDLIKKVGDKTGLYAVLNTSLNIMGEPIVETIEDVRRFFEVSPVDYLCVGDYIIERSV